MGRAQRRDVAVGVDVGHDVVPFVALVGVGCGEVDVIDLGAHLRQHRGSDARRYAVVGEQAELGLGLGQGDPELAPGGELAPRAPQLGHGRAGVAADQRVVVDIQRIHDSLPQPHLDPSARPLPSGELARTARTARPG